MTTAAFVVKSAAEVLGASSIINPLAPESENAAFKRLLQMLNRWTSKDINLGDSFVLPIELASEIGNDPDTEQAIIDNAAIMIAPILRKSPTVFLMRTAYDAYQDLLISSVPRPEQPLPSSTPLGAGRRTRPFTRAFYNEPARKDKQTVLPNQE